MIPPDLNSYLLHVENVYKQYGERVILDNVDLSVRDGELCTVVGPSGCGKSTLLRLILGQEEPTHGKVFIDGKEVGYPGPQRGIVYQRYALFPHLTVLDNVLLGARLTNSLLGWRHARDAAIEQANYYLQRVGLGKHGKHYPHELSGGMQQRAAIAQALVKKPRILLMDEPFGALDPQTREDLQLFLLELWEELRMTIFFVTHDLEEAVFLGTRIFALSQYYTDDRGTGDHVRRGAKIVFDRQLPRAATSTIIKQQPEFIELIQQIRQSAFDSDILQHARHFDLNHPDSWQTLTDDESRPKN